MLITKDFIYFELIKTASTHTRDLFVEIYQNQHLQLGVHNMYSELPHYFLNNFDQKLKVGNIRNPWDWYVSLWTYGCKRTGTLYRHLTADYRFPRQKIRHQFNKFFGDLNTEYFNQWKTIYSDPFNKKNFNIWLQRLLGPEKFITGDDYKELPLSSAIGYFTYHYLRLFTYWKDFSELSTMGDFKKLDEQQNFLDFIIKLESIESDVSKFLYQINRDPEEIKTLRLESRNKMNESKRMTDYRSYYDDDSIKLVAKYDELVVQKYGYKF